MGDTIPKETKNILLIKSYHEGYAWTDSLTSGMINCLKPHPEITLYIENLNSKRFGQTQFEFEKEYIKKKYEEIEFSGILVTDNDALDFVFKYKNTLFPSVPVVFTGVSNPEDYPLEGSTVYGFTESVNTDHVLDFVRELLPDSRRVLVLTDMTTTGTIYRKEFKAQSEKFKNLQVIFPDEIDLDLIYQMVSSKAEFDAIYYIGIGQDKYGNLVDFISLGDTIAQLAKAPFFANDPVFNGKGVIGGMYQSGKKQGNEAAKLLIHLMDSSDFKPEARYFETYPDYFFDQHLLDMYNIPKSRIPKGSKIINTPQYHDSKYILGLISTLVLLFIIVLYLYDSNRKIKRAKHKISAQFQQIQEQNKELATAHDQLGEVISELELANSRLQETNMNLTLAKKKAEESDNLKSAFLANVSHEIRTPLNSIVGFSSLLSEPDLNYEVKKSYIDLVESNTESLLVLIDEIIDLSKIEAQQLTLKKQSFSIDILLSELFQVFSQMHVNSKIELKIRRISETKELFAYSDRVRINQMFVNLLSNAYKFTDSGTIEFGYFEAENNEIQLFVRDSGIGIKEEYHQVIFDRFRKLNTNDSKLYSGTGLGLAITRKLVELLGGRIWINSEPGKGTIFFFTLDGLDLKDLYS